MQERVRAVEFVLSRCGLSPEKIAEPERPARRQTVPPIAAGSPRVENWPYALVENADHEA
jgi:hypothetical protein